MPDCERMDFNILVVILASRWDLRAHFCFDIWPITKLLSICCVLPAKQYNLLCEQRIIHKITGNNHPVVVPLVQNHTVPVFCLVRLGISFLLPTRGVQPFFKGGFPRLRMNSIFQWPGGSSSVMLTSTLSTHLGLLLILEADRTGIIFQQCSTGSGMKRGNKSDSQNCSWRSGKGKKIEERKTNHQSYI